ncbi:MAG: PTS transporter subunit EIIC, partial [Clostridiales bacterium]|nr:PTS transporter subunit EIIC [Clostridiales bacterium]
MDYNQIAKDILQNVGGQENIDNLTHCFTRLRFVLKDESKVNKEVLERIEGVISVVFAGGQCQVVCGAKVTKIYEAVASVMGLAEEEVAGQPKKEEEKTSKSMAQQEGQKQSPLNLVLQKVTEMFTPLIPAIAASGLIKGLLTAAQLLMKQRGVDITTSDTYTILYSASQVIFYFLPIFLAMTCAKAFKCNQIISMAIGATLVYPAIDALIQNTEVASTIFGLPIMKGEWQIGEATKVFSYTESVIPIILAVIVMSYLEKGLKKVIPEVLQIILVPGLELVIMLPLTFVVLGPIGIYVGNGIQFVYDGLMGFSTILGGALIGGLWCICVIFGAHRALLPIGLNDVAVNGHQNLLAFAGAANFSQGGAAFGIMLRTKKKALKQVAASAGIAATLVGVTEPAIYGCNLRLKKPMIFAVICGAIGGAIMGAGNVYGDAFANNGVLTIFTYAAFGMTKFFFYLAGIAVAFFGSAV